MTIQRCQSEITSSEFMDWIAYLDNDVNVFHREDYYFAELIAEVRRSWVEDKKSVKLKDFLLKFKFKKEVKKMVKNKMTKEEAARKAKSFFGVPNLFRKKAK
jgi:hypothetical protein